MSSPSRSAFSSWVMTLTTVGSVALVVAACGSSKTSSFDDPDAGGASSGGFVFDGSITGNGGQPDAGDTYANDPPPKYCVLAGQPTPPKPGGTEQCPDDKNLPGCACDTLGATAPCFTGLRVNRGLGQCKDGTTTCQKVSETSQAWGECVGEVLPRAGQTKGRAACKCFSKGEWKLSTTTTCFIEYKPDNVTYALSSGLDGNCLPVNGPAPPAKPAQDWSTDTLTVDCAGHFTLCYEIKAGAFDNPQPTDCSLAKLCVDGDYPKANVETAFPNMPAWASPDAACAAKWIKGGGYAEMSVVGESVLCDKIDDGAGKAYVFNRVKYCSPECSENPSGPGCANCGQGGSGTF